ncbi:MAG: 50S ribosomal protein L10 [Bacillota bacterium]|nr:50S ribosomal protein L10 [Bacillota bacterium]MDW7683792.1 50S ribosomal protein L10 [Bacillota bacterium]
MSITKADKKQVVSEVKEDLQNAKTAIVTDYRGLNVEQITKLRRALYAENVKYSVIKNTLASIAAHELGLEALDVYLEGPTAIAYGFDDPVAPAKVLSKYAKDFDKLEIKGGLLEGTLIDPARIKALADLPSREVLLGQVAGAFASPMTGFAGAAQGILRKFVGTLDAVREKKEAEAS